jgi:hypothetical protein
MDSSRARLTTLTNIDVYRDVVRHHHSYVSIYRAYKKRHQSQVLGRYAIGLDFWLRKAANII